MSSTALRFAIVGVIGFVVDAGVLHVLMSWLRMPAAAGRVVSFLCASFVTWRLNRTFTFRAVDVAGSAKEWLHYLWASIIGASVNYGVFLILVLSVPLVARSPSLGVAVGSVAGMVINFTLYRNVVFRRERYRSSQ